MSAEARRWSVTQFLHAAGEGAKDPGVRVGKIGPTSYRCSLDRSKQRDYSVEAFVRLETDILREIGEEFGTPAADAAESVFRKVHVTGRQIGSHDEKAIYMDLCGAVKRNLETDPFPSEAFFDENEIWWTCREAAAKLNVKSVNTVKDLIRAHNWRTKWERNQLVVRCDDVLFLIQSRANKAKGKGKK